RGHEIEIVRPKSARDPQLRRHPMPARLAVGGHGDPIRMRGLHVIVGRVRIGAGDGLAGGCGRGNAPPVPCPDPELTETICSRPVTFARLSLVYGWKD